MNREFELSKEVELPASVDEVWQAISTGPGMTAWYMPMDIDPRGDEVVAWEPARRLTIRTPEAPDGSVHAFDYLIEARDGASTTLRFVHSGVFGDDWSEEFEGMASAGWDMYLHTLAAYLRHFPSQQARYVEAEAPPAPDGWATLHAALGSRPRRLGDTVHIEPDSGPGLRGEIDYLTENFLGLRTADALIRFHERSAIGMSIAVGAHYYGQQSDRQPDTESWRHWLAVVVGKENE